jgi:Xaa-Pro dipeptidase
MFDHAEIRQRLKCVQAQVKQSGLDALVLCTDANIGYLIGLHCELGERMALLVVPAKGEPSLIVPRLEQEPMRETVSVDNVLVYWEKDSKPGRNWYDLLYQTLGEARRIGIDGKADLDVSLALADYHWQVSNIVEAQRVIKSPAEIALIRKVANYWTDAMNAMLSVAKAGVPLSELAAAGDQVAKQVFVNESAANWINTRVIQFFQCSPASSSPHHLSHRPDECLPHGPTTINAIGSVCDYYAENERTILTGDYTSEHAELFDITHRGHELALSLIKPGVSCAEVDCAVQAYFTQQGLAEHMKHRIGHGMGLIDQERPYLSEGSEDIFQPGMLFSVEPGLYVNGVGGFRHSDTVLITHEGIEVLTAGTPIDRQGLTF